MACGCLRVLHVNESVERLRMRQALCHSFDLRLTKTALLRALRVSFDAHNSHVRVYLQCACMWCVCTWCVRIMQAASLARVAACTAACKVTWVRARCTVTAVVTTASQILRHETPCHGLSARSWGSCMHGMQCVRVVACVHRTHR